MNKPIFILLHGFSSSKIYWNYKDDGTYTLKKLNFLDNLKKIGYVYEYTMDFFNIMYYYTIKNIEENKRIHIIYEKYKPYTSKLNFKIEDLLYENICKDIHNKVTEKYGKNKKYILVCHSYGCVVGLLYSKIYKNECLFNVMIDSSPYYIEYFKQMLNSKYGKNEKKTVDEYLHNNEQLKTILDKIKNKNENDNVNKEINMVFDLISYLDWNERIKYYDKKLPIFTLCFRAIYPNTTDKSQNKWNKWGLKEKKIFEKNNSTNNFKYICMPNANHFIWFNQKYSDDIINEIKKTLYKIM